jgi:hypothetical protein
MPLLAATKTWSGAVDSNWSTPGNWSPSAVAAGDALVFPPNPQRSAMVNDLLAGMSFASLDVQASSYDLTGNLIGVAGPIYIHAYNPSSALKGAGVDATLRLIDGAGAIDPYWTSTAAYAEVDAFFDAHLKTAHAKRRGAGR